MHALMATTTFRARTTPDGVSTASGWPFPTRRRIGVFSYTLTPIPIATRLSPRTSRAGCTVAAFGEKTPARCLREPARSATCAGVRRSKEEIPCASNAAITASVEPTWDSLVAVKRVPSRRNSASIRCSLQKPSMSKIACSLALTNRTASVSPNNRRSVKNFVDQLRTQPPFPSARACATNIRL